MHMYLFYQVRTLIQMQTQFPSQLKTNVRFSTHGGTTKAEVNELQRG